MVKRIVINGALLLAAPAAFAQQDTTTVAATAPVGPIYKVNNAVDIPLTAGATAWTLFGFSRIYNKDESSEAKILSLKKSDINGFDRWAVRPYSKKNDADSYIPFYAAMPLPPAVFLIDKKMRKDALKLSFLYLEAMAVTGVLYTSATLFTNRYRPYSYDAGTPMETKIRGAAKNSFFAGHVALVATSTFFLASVYDQYHPHSGWKWAFYGVAGASTAFTAYLRHRGGFHFPSDILLGTAVGTASGLLMPHWHKNKLIKNKHISILPFAGQSNGLTMLYKL